MVFRGDSKPYLTKRIYLTTNKRIFQDIREDSTRPHANSFTSNFALVPVMRKGQKMTKLKKEKKLSLGLFTLV